MYFTFIINSTVLIKIRQCQHLAQLSIGDFLANHLHRTLKFIEGDVSVVVSVEDSARKV
jgi:hypothetical protein